MTQNSYIHLASDLTGRTLSGGHTNLQQVSLGIVFGSITKDHAGNGSPAGFVPKRSQSQAVGDWHELDLSLVMRA